MKCVECDNYVPFRDEKYHGICDIDDNWDAVFAQNKCKKENKTCFDCKFYDGTCCMYNCAVRAIFNENKEALACKHYDPGEYDVKKLEETDYK